MMIDIPVIKDLALAASIGVAVLIFTNLILLPVLLSLCRRERRRRRAQPARRKRRVPRPRVRPPVRRCSTRFAERRWALAALVAAALLLALGYHGEPAI